jgi:putative intracellular protease/amidase
MAEDTLKGLNVAILVTDGFEQVELTEPRKALDEAGATTKIVSPKHQRVRAWNFMDWGIELQVDVDLDRPSRKISTRCCCRVALSTRIRFAFSQMRLPSRRRSSMLENQLQRSAMAPGQ